MQLKTYTELWHVENRLYKFYDVNLPFPIATKQLGIGVLAFIPWFFLMNLIGVPFAPPIGVLVWLAPPGFLTWWGSKPVAEGKNLYDFLLSQIRYKLNPKTYAGLVPTELDEDQIILDGRIWSRL